MVVIPKKFGDIRITVNYKKLNKLNILGQFPIPRVDEVLDRLGTSRIFSFFDLVSSFHQITVHKDTVPFTALCTPTRLFEWLEIPQGSSAAPGWFVKVINEVIKGLDRVAAYLDDGIVFDSDPSLHVTNMRDFFLRLRKHNLKRSRRTSSCVCESTTSSVHLQRLHSAPRTRISSVTPPIPLSSCQAQKSGIAVQNAHADRPYTAALSIG